VLATSSTGLVYSVPARVPGPVGLIPGTTLGGCTFSSGRRVALGSDTAGDRVVRLSGSTAAIASTMGMGVDTSSSYIEVRDISTGRPLLDLQVGNAAIAPSAVTVDALVVTPPGAVAWINHGGTSQRPGYEVHAAGPGTAPHLLDAGTEVVPGSLTLNGSTVSWTRGGTTRSARLG
jgi:hypothetical protein